MDQESITAWQKIRADYEDLLIRGRADLAKTRALLDDIDPSSEIAEGLRLCEKRILDVIARSDRGLRKVPL